jgi:hypothetical protein
MVFIKTPIAKALPVPMQLTEECYLEELKPAVMELV